MIYVVSVLTFLVMVLTVEGLYYLYEDRKAAKMEKLLSRFIPRQEVVGMRKRLLKKRRNEEHFSRFIGIPRLREILIEANLAVSVERFIFMSSGCAVIFFIAGVIIFNTAILSLFLFVLGFLIPFLYLLYRKGKREASVIEQLPDVVELMARSLRSGQSLDRALQEVGSQFSEPLGPEVRRMCEENAMGIPFESAMRNFESRFPHLTDIRIFCTSLIIQRKTGGNLTELLEGLSNTIRERFKVKREVKALTAEGRISSIVLGILPFAFGGLTYLLNPDYIRMLFVHPIGQKVLLLAMAFEAAGFAVMRALTKIEV